MQPKYCQYCGEPLEERCSCEMEIAEYGEQMNGYYDDYYPEFSENPHLDECPRWV